jgi:hypothetical protein
MLCEEKFALVYYDPDTEELVYEHPYDGGLTGIEGIALTEPCTLESYETFAESVIKGTSGGAIGFVFDEDGSVIAILDDCTAEKRELIDIYKPTGEQFGIYTDCVPLSEEGI